MKKIFLALLLLLCINVFAQKSKLDETARLESTKDVPGRSDSFWGIPFGITKDSVISILKNVKNIDYESSKDNSIDCIGVTFGEQKVMGISLYFSRGFFSKSVVIFDAQNETNCVIFFNKIRRDLSAKYGVPSGESKDNEFIEGLRPELQAFNMRMGKKHLSNSWDFSNVNFFSQIKQIGIGVDKNCCTYLFYYTQNFLTEDKSAEAMTKLQDY